MQPSEGRAQDFVEGITHDKRRRDAGTLVQLFEQVTGEEPRLWGNIVGFGQ